MHKLWHEDELRTTLFECTADDGQSSIVIASSVAVAALWEPLPALGSPW